MEGAAPIIVTALLSDEDQAWADGLRRAHFPPERNLIAAHLTMFHALPPSAGPELTRRLRESTRGVPAPAAIVGGVMDLGGGTALRVVSEDLVRLRGELAHAFAGSLTAQDGQGWRPHITIQNKVVRADARALQGVLAGQFDGRRLRIAGLGAWAYRGGPWDALSSHRFG